jgi:excisionase family DNA binding protein
MSSQLSVDTGSKPQKPVPPAAIKLLTPKEAAELLKVSLSWLAKARMRGDGPAYMKVGERAVRYSEAALLQWMKSRQRLSTSEE